MVIRCGSPMSALSRLAAIQPKFHLCLKEPQPAIFAVLPCPESSRRRRAAPASSASACIAAGTLRGSGAFRRAGDLVRLGAAVWGGGPWQDKVARSSVGAPAHGQALPGLCLCWGGWWVASTLRFMAWAPPVRPSDAPVERLPRWARTGPHSIASSSSMKPAIIDRPLSQNFGSERRGRRGPAGPCGASIRRPCSMSKYFSWKPGVALFVDGVKRVHQAVAEGVGVDVERRVDEVRDVGPERLVAVHEGERGAEAFALHATSTAR